MTLKTGELDDNNKPQQKSDVAALTEVVLKLQRELEEVKKANSKPQASSDEMLADLMGKFAASQKKASELDYQGGIKVADIPLDDYDEEGVLFCAPFTGYVISDDVRKGFRVTLPYNKPSITFEFEGVKPIQEGKHVKLMNMCKYRSHSKEEIKWLREFTFFNTFIYESTRGVVNFDVLKAQKMARIMTHLSTFEMPQLIKACKDYNVSIDGNDIAVMRTNLAIKMSESELARDRDSTQRRLIELEKEKSLLMQNRA